MTSRIYYQDGTFKDVEDSHAWEYENDPDYSHTTKTLDSVVSREPVHDDEE